MRAAGRRWSPCGLGLAIPKDVLTASTGDVRRAPCGIGGDCRVDEDGECVLAATLRSDASPRPQRVLGPRVGSFQPGSNPAAAVLRGQPASSTWGERRYDWIRCRARNSRRNRSRLPRYRLPATDPGVDGLRRLQWRYRWPYQLSRAFSLTVDDASIAGVKVLEKYNRVDRSLPACQASHSPLRITSRPSSSSYPR